MPHGIPHGRICSDFWDADHIKPVIEGGGECGLDNYRTLCIPCHQKVTKELRGRMANRAFKDKAMQRLKEAQARGFKIPSFEVERPEAPQRNSVCNGVESFDFGGAIQE